MKKNAVANAARLPSALHHAIAMGGSSVRLNRESRMPRIRWTTVICIFVNSTGNHRKVIPTWNSFSTSGTCFLSATRRMT